ncbi:MAG: DUF4363 family protein [Clostridia bacterium]|nr:DUF4363 family protein [Clostridia bacterium]
MKRLIIAVIFIAFSIILGVYSLTKTTRLCNNMIIRIESATKDNTEILENSSHEKRINFYNSLVSLNDIWEENSDFFYYFFNNDDIKTIETNIEKLPVHAKNGDLESTYLCLVECLEEFEYIKNSSSLELNNIF